MNEEKIESVLRKAPPVRVPAELLSELQSNIVLPAQHEAAARDRITHPPRFTINAIRRWMPALGFTLWILGCMIVLGIQSSTIARLKEQNSAGSVAAGGTAIPQNKNANAADASPELVQLRKDAADTQRLRAESQRLREMLAQAPVLRAANAQLLEELKSQIEPPPKSEEDMFAMAKGKAATVACVNNLKQMMLAALIWADDRHKKGLSALLPTDLDVLQSYVSKGKVFFCPGDEVTKYELISSGTDKKEPWVVYVRCPIHNNVGLVDGSVQQIGTRRVIQIDGRWGIEPPAKSTEPK